MWTSHQDHLTTRWVRAALQSVPRVWCLSSICCLTEDLRESSPQFLECRGPLLCPSRLRRGCTWAQLCSVLWLTQQRRSCSVLFRLVASFSPLRIVVHFWVFTSPVSANTLPLISTSLLRWLVCVCSRIGCSQQSKGHSGTGLLEFLIPVDSTFLSGRKCSQAELRTLLKVPLSLFLL